MPRQKVPAPGLMIFGLHHDLPSDTDDTDYEPAKNEISPVKKRKTVRPKSRRFGEFSLDDSSDSDYEPDGKKVKKVYITRTKQKTESKKKSLSIDHATPHIRHTHPASNDTWSALPTEILVHIMYYLSLSDNEGVKYVCRCACVCRNWNILVSQPIAWKYVNLSFIGGSKLATDALLKQLTEEKFTEIKYLSLCGWLNLGDDGLESVATHCTRLESLNISSCQKKSISKINGPTLVPLAENCPLKRINFSNLRIPTGYSKNMLTVLELRGEHLTHINISNNIAFGSALLTSISNNCYQLVSLDVSNTCVRAIDFRKLQETCSKLQELFLTNLMLEPKNTPGVYAGFADLRVCSVAKTIPSNWLFNDLLLNILKTASNLNTLDIRGNNEIDDAGFLIPAIKIERLYMSRCRVSYKIIQIICEKWNETLWDLDMSWCEAYGTNFSVLIEVLVKGGLPCLKLTHFNLQGTAVYDSAVKLILISCKDLLSIDLTSCRGVSRGIKRRHNGDSEIAALKCFYNIKK